MASERLVLLLLVGTALVVVDHCCKAQGDDSSCNFTSLGIQPVPYLDIIRLADKKWYVQEIFSRSLEEFVEPSFECHMTYMSLYSGIILVPAFVDQFTDLSTGLATHNTTAAMIEGDMAVYRISVDHDRELYTAVWTHTDYENYGVLHWCPYPDNPEEGSRAKYERVMTFTGTPNPDEALLSNIREMVSSLEFTTEYGIQIRHHEDCDYGLCEAVDESCCDPNGVNAPPISDFHHPNVHDKRWFIQEIFFLREEQATAYAHVAPSCYAQTAGRYFMELLALDDVFTPVNSSSNSFSGHYVSPGVAPTDKAIWEVARQTSLDRFRTVWTHTDYETYGVTHWCPYMENTEEFNKAEHVVTFTGIPNPGQGLLQELRDKVARFGFPTEHSVRIHHHDECDYEKHSKWW